MTARASGLTLRLSSAASICAAALLLAGCSRNRAGHGVAATPLDDHVRWERTIALQENDAVVNVNIRATPDPLGGYLVSDEEEDQVRRYDPAGRLLTVFGRRGPGPKEFDYLYRAFRLPSGEILALDVYSRAAVFDSAGANVHRTFRLPLARVGFAQLVSDTLLLLGGTRLDAGGRPMGGERLHLWSLASNRILRSFFPVRPRGSAQALAANTADFLGAAVRGDTVAAAFSVIDTVYLFTLRGQPVRKLPLASSGFRRLSPSRSLPRMDVAGAREWFQSFSLISDVFWLRDGSFLVQYEDRHGPEPRWRLVRMSAMGEPLFESRDTPELLAVDPHGNTLFFVKPGSLTPNVWSVAHLRS
jgi:hypothetical protein